MIAEGKVTFRELGGNEIKKVMALYRSNKKEGESSLLTGIELGGVFSSGMTGWRKNINDMILLEVILAWTFKNKGPNEEFTSPELLNSIKEIA